MTNDVTVVIPIWKESLTKYEEISFRQNIRILNSYQFSIITHKKIKLEKILSIFNEYKVAYSIVFFDERFFKNISGYNNLLLSFHFYYRFIKFKYILVCQLDCFVFKDELHIWIEQGYSYIGAPWVKGYAKALEDDPIIGVGNGGFSLRHVRDHLRVLLSFKYIKYPFEIFNVISQVRDKSVSNLIFFILRNITISNNTFFLFNNWEKNEDCFWGIIANRFSWFSVPDWRIAARFSVEVHPERFMKIIPELPFGCHAWWSYDLAYWKPHIERFGHEL